MSILVPPCLLMIVIGSVANVSVAALFAAGFVMPVVTRLGIDVIHHRAVVVAATGIGLLLPPIGVGFFIACGIASVPATARPPR